MAQQGIVSVVYPRHLPFDADLARMRSGSLMPKCLCQVGEGERAIDDRVDPRLVQRHHEILLLAAIPEKSPTSGTGNPSFHCGKKHDTT